MRQKGVPKGSVLHKCSEKTQKWSSQELTATEDTTQCSVADAVCFVADAPLRQQLAAGAQLHSGQRNGLVVFAPALTVRNM